MAHTGGFVAGLLAGLLFRAHLQRAASAAGHAGLGVRMSPAEEAAGLFGPDSVSWRIDSELVVLAGGSCALLMQAAHPMVAAGVVEHSTFATDPFGRLMRTLESSFDVVFGSRTTAEAAIRRVNAIHRSVTGPDAGWDLHL